MIRSEFKFHDCITNQYVACTQQELFWNILFIKKNFFFYINPIQAGILRALFGYLRIFRSIVIWHIWMCHDTCKIVYN